MNKKFFAAEGAFDEINDSNDKINIGIGTGSTTTIFIIGFIDGLIPPLLTRMTFILCLVATCSISFLTGQASASTYICKIIIPFSVRLRNQFF